VAYAVFSFILFIVGFVAGCIVCRRVGASQAERTRRVDDDYRELGEQQTDIAKSIDRAGEVAAGIAGTVERAIDNNKDAQGTVESMGNDVHRAGDILADIQKRHREGTSE